MTKAKRWLARFMAVVMLFSAMSISAFAENDAEADDPSEAYDLSEDVVVYNLLDCEMPVGSDEALYEAGELADLFEEDGSYTIRLEDDAFFPYEVQFTYDGDTWEEWFMSADDTVEVGGHTFRVLSESCDPTAVTQLGLVVSGDYCTVWPEEKDFTATPQISAFSMLPLQEHYCSVDLTDYFREELSNVSISAIAESLEINGEVAVWARWGYYDEDGDYVDENDDYTAFAEDDTLDLTSKYIWDTYCALELIVGTADQLNSANERYIIDIYTTRDDDLLDVKAYTKDDQRENIFVYDTYYAKDWTGDGKNVLQVEVDPEVWETGEEFYLGLSAVSGFSELDVTVYEGYYETEEEIAAAGEAAKDITAQIWAQENLSSEGGYLKDYSYKRYYEGMPEVTLVFERNGSVIKVMPIVLYAYEAYMSVNFNTGMYTEDEDGDRTRVTKWASWSTEWIDRDMGYMLYTITLNEGYPADGEYYWNMSIYDPAGEREGVDCVEKAAVGHYGTIPESAVDIKEQLFSNAYESGGGYCADYSEGIIFTVLDIWGCTHYMAVQTEEYEESVELPSAPTPGSSDTYFRMTGADGVENEETPRSGDIRSYVMPYEADSYYYNGYQTAFLLNREWDSENGEYVYTPVTGEKIIPRFYTGYGVEIFAGHDGISGTKQLSGETQLSFEHGKAILYSAAAENGTELKNYWVTFLTQQSGAKLFVNATNDPSRYVTVTDEATGEESVLPQREVFLTEAYDNHHDVFFANIGDAEITGLYVRLENAQNVALDKYWTVGETTSLAAFTTTDPLDADGDWVGYGELANFAKVRLVAATDENGEELAGEISGTLVIGYTGGEGETGEEVRIQLTGMAGTPKITTEEVLDGVKYVPYSSIIQTNSMYAAYAPSFRLTGGELPDGLSLKPNGEIYGVPSAAGEYTFMVTATFGEDEEKSDSREFTLTIEENTNANVEAVNSSDQGYELIDHVGTPTVDENNETYYAVNVNEAPEEGYVFHSAGVYGDFMSFYLDGRELTAEKDYDAEEGSTKITIRAQTFKNAGNGTHTIAAEFRTDKAEDGTMKRSAQNIQVSGAASSSSSSSSSAKKYSVTIGNYVGGSIAASSDRAAEGKSVTLTITLADGYTLEKLEASGVTLVKLSETKYTFVMPSENVTITASFAKQEAMEDSLSFTDVKENDWFFSAVKFVYENALMIGTSEDTFDPDAITTKGMAAMILYNMEGRPEVTGTVSLNGVDAGAYYEQAVAWAVQNGIIDADGSFGADEPITREQMVELLYRYAAYKGWNVSESADLSGFIDASEIGGALLEEMQWACGVGVIRGTSDVTLEPQGVATRAQTAKMLMNFCMFFEMF